MFQIGAFTSKGGPIVNRINEFRKAIGLPVRVNYGNVIKGTITFATDDGFKEMRIPNFKKNE